MAYNIVFTSDELFLNNRKKCIGGNSTVVVCIAAHVYVATHPPVSSPAVYKIICSYLEITTLLVGSAPCMWTKILGAHAGEALVINVYLDLIWKFITEWLLSLLLPSQLYIPHHNAIMHGGWLAGNGSPYCLIVYVRRIKWKSYRDKKVGFG